MNGELAEARLRHSRRPVEYGLILVGLTALFCLLYGGTFSAYFSVLEEHRIVSDSHRSMTEWLEVMADDTLGFGRFRPMFFVFHFGKILLFGPNPQLFHIVTVGLGVLTGFLFYIAARKIGADVGSALAFVLLFSITGSQGVIWHQVFGPQEMLGMFLTAAAVWALVEAASRRRSNSWDAVALVAMALAGLTKESFVLIIPALLLLRCALHCWFTRVDWMAALRTLRRPLQTGAVIFAVEVVTPVGVLLLRPVSYGSQTAGLSLSSFDPRVWGDLLVSPGLGRLSVYLLTGMFVSLVYYSWPGHELSRPYLVAALLIAAVWLLPQLVLHSHGIFERYLFPAIVAPAAIVALALSMLWRTPSWITRMAWVAGLLSLLPVFSKGMAETSEAADRYAADTLATKEVITYLAKTVAATRVIIIAADLATPYGYEASYALPLYLRAAAPTSRAYVWPVLDPAGRSNLHAAFAEATAAAFAYPSTLTSDEVGGIVLATPPTDFVSVPSWFANSQWRELAFSKTYYEFVLFKLRYERRGSVTHSVLVPGEEAPVVPMDHPLVSVAPSLRGRLGINPLLRTPWWGLEQDKSASVLWLGDRVDGVMTSMVWAAGEQRVEVACDVVAGPGREDGRRTVEFTFANAAGTTTERRTFDGSAVLTFSGKLSAGRNELQLKVVDQATIRTQPNGDPRPLLVLLRRMTVLSPPG